MQRSRWLLCLQPGPLSFIYVIRGLVLQLPHGHSFAVASRGDGGRSTAAHLQDTAAGATSGSADQPDRRLKSDLTVRWVLLTLPGAMVFDDHNIHDDWKHSAVRAPCWAQAWLMHQRAHGVCCSIST